MAIALSMPSLQLGFPEFGIFAEMIEDQELNPDQSRESINTEQRFRSFREARAQRDNFRGSMVFVERNGV